MVYSQFRTFEGIGIFKLVLEANGYAEFKSKEGGGNWVLDIVEEDKLTFALYTGTEDDDKKKSLEMYLMEIGSLFHHHWKLNLD